MSDEPIASVDTPQATPPASPQKYLKWTPPSTQRQTRIITAKDFQKVGVEMQDVKWSRDNAWLVPVDDWNIAAIELVLTEPGFALLDNSAR